MTSPQFQIWWERTPIELHRPSRVEVYKSWEKALKRWLKENEGKDETDFSDVLLIAIAAETRYRKQKEAAKQFHPDWPMGTTWINQSRWTAEFVDVPVSQLTEEKEIKKCGCGETAISGNKCPRCYTKALGDRSSLPLSMLGDALKRLGLWRAPGESSDAWGRRCREHATRHFGRMMDSVRAARRPVLAGREPGSDDEEATP